jgi:histidinol-phosphatase (PHP family)
MIDLHTHLWEHGPGSLRVERGRLEAYCDQAAARGVTTIAVTEHLERFRQLRPLLDGAWADDPRADLRDFMDRRFDEEQGADLDDYVSGLQWAQSDGLPILIGVELGWWPDRTEALAALVGDYPFDIVLGSVHNIGAWMFDAYDDPAVAAEWDQHDPELAWETYTAAVEDLAASGVCDVLAHVDLVKITGTRPDHMPQFHERLVDAAADHDVAVEVSSAGLRKPVNEIYPSAAVLPRLHERDVPVTLASDAHRVTDVAVGNTDLRRQITGAGYDSVATYRRRRRELVPLPATAGADGREALDEDLGSGSTP